MARPPRHIQAILFVLCVLPMVLAGYLLRAAAAEHRAEQPRPIPAPPQRPHHAVEHTGPASDGGRVIVRRSRAWIWAWVESPGTYDCRPSAYLTNDLMWVERPRGVRRDGSFDLRGDYWTRFHVPPRSPR